MVFIYVITNKINGKQYVGKTTHDSIEKRWKEHIKDSKNKKYEKRPLYDAINKYGSENFVIEELEECSINVLEDKEIYWINKLGTYHNGYNATRGGDGKILYDYKEIADKYLKLQSVKETAEYFNCDITTVRTACKSYQVLMLSPIEVAAKTHGKPIAMLDKQTDEILDIFPSILQASYAITGTKSGHRHISDVAKGKRKTAYGYKWKLL